MAVADYSVFLELLFCLDNLQCLFNCLHFSLKRRAPCAGLYGMIMVDCGITGVASSDQDASSACCLLFVAEPSMSMVGWCGLQSLASLCNALILSFSTSPFFAPTTSPFSTPTTPETCFPVCGHGGRCHRVLSVCVDPKVDLQTSLAFFLYLVFFVHWRTSAVDMCFL